MAPAIAESFSTTSELCWNNTAFAAFTESCIGALRLPASSANSKARGEAIAEMQKQMYALREISILLEPQLQFVPFVFKLVNDQNFKVALGAMLILSNLVTKAGSKIKPYLEPLVGELADKIGDTKAMTRQLAMHILSMLMRNIPPQKVLDCCLQYRAHENPRVREELCNVLIAALLTFNSAEFDFKKLVQDLWGMLANNKAKVKYVVVESLAIIASKTGSGTMLEYLYPLGPDATLLQLLALRLQDPTLPQLNLDGTVEHIIARSASTTPRPISANKGPASIMSTPQQHTNQKTTASVRSASSSNRSRGSETPPPLKLDIDSKKNSIETLYSPRSPTSPNAKSVPASPSRRTRLPWEKRVVSGQYRSPQSPPPLLLASPSQSGNDESPKIETLSLGGKPGFMADMQAVKALASANLARAEVAAMEATTAASTETLPSLSLAFDKVPASPQSAKNPTDEWLQHPYKVGQTSEPVEVSAVPERRVKRLGISEPASPRAARRALQRIEAVTNAGSREEIPKAKSAELSLPSLSGDSDCAVAKAKTLRTKVNVKFNAPLKVQATKNTLQNEKSIDPERDLQLAVLKLRDNGEWTDTAGLVESTGALLEAIKAQDKDVNPQLVHDVAAALGQQVCNLRTSVSKVAVGVVRVFFDTFGRLADPDVDALGRILLKKMGESKGFLVDETDRALNCMVERVSPMRSLTVIIQTSSHKSSLVREKCAQLLCKLFSKDSAVGGLQFCERIGAAPQELERLLPVMVQFLRDGSGNTRYAARHTLLYIYESNSAANVTKVMEKLLPKSHLSEVYSAMDWARANRDVMYMAGTSSATSVSRTNSSKVSTLKKSLSSAQSSTSNAVDSDGFDLKSLVDDLSSHLWTTRYEAITRIAEQIQSNSKFYSSPPQRLSKWFEIYMERLRDGNAKVQMHALQSLSSILPAMADNLETIPAALLPAIASNLASVNSALRQASSDIFDVLVNLLQQTQEHADRLRALMNAVESMSSLIMYNGNSRMKPMLVDKLVDLVEVANSVKPLLITKYFVPVAVYLCGESKLEIKASTLALVNEMHRVVGPVLFDITNPLTRDSGHALLKFKENLES